MQDDDGVVPRDFFDVQEFAKCCFADMCAVNKGKIDFFSV